MPLGESYLLNSRADCISVGCPTFSKYGPTCAYILFLFLSCKVWQPCLIKEILCIARCSFPPKRSHFLLFGTEPFLLFLSLSLSFYSPNELFKRPSFPPLLLQECARDKKGEGKVGGRLSDPGIISRGILRESRAHGIVMSRPYNGNLRTGKRSLLFLKRTEPFK